MKRSKTLSSYFSIQTQQSNQSLPETVGTGPSHNEQNNPHVELSPDDVVADPGLRKPIEELDVKIRDAARREYLQLGPCQPSGHKFPRKDQGGQKRRFQGSWFKRYDWLEYSVAQDAAFCFYCYLFKQQRTENFGVDAFTKVGFSYWKNGIKSFDDHVGKVNSAHNKARRHCEAFKNQRQGVDYVMTAATKKDEEEYRARLTIMLGIAKFLLLQALAFRGHDESSSSSNRGNFLEMLKWYKEKDGNVAKLLDNAPGNNLMTSHHIQKQLCKACAEETTKVIIDDIGDRQFAVLIDEARDASIKEQMAVVLRYVNIKGQVIERFLGVQHVSDTTSFSLKLALDGLIGTTLKTIEVIRNCGWDELFEESNAFCLQHNILVPNMSDKIPVRGRSRGRGSQMVTYYDHFHHEIFIVVHDQIIVELNNRFAERSTQLLRCIACLDPKNSFANFDEDKLIELARMYAADFSQYDCIVLRDQLGTFIADVRDDLDFAICTDLGNLAVKMVQTDRHTVFPLVYRLVELALILPVATATVERAFSAMSIIKTDLRNKMNDEWMNHSMVCYIERDIFASTKDDKILERF